VDRFSYRKMKNLMSFILFVFLWTLITFILWVGFARFAVVFLPEVFWIPCAMLGMVIGINFPFVILSKLEKI
jgi:Co/Zn/Cd efflux system component